MLKIGAEIGYKAGDAFESSVKNSGALFDYFLQINCYFLTKELI